MSSSLFWSVHSGRKLLPLLPILPCGALTGIWNWNGDSTFLLSIELISLSLLRRLYKVGLFKQAFTDKRMPEASWSLDNSNDCSSDNDFFFGLFGTISFTVSMQKFHWAKLNKQGRLFWLLELGIEAELNSPETNDVSVFKHWRTGRRGVDDGMCPTH